MPVDLSGEMFSAYERSLAQAKLYFQQNRFPEAAGAYRQCAMYLDKYSAYSKSPAIQARWKKQAEDYRSLAERIEKGKFALPAESSTEGPSNQDDYQDIITSLIHKSTITWDNIAGLEETKREIKAAYGLAMARKPDGVKLEGWRNILFYGPPGTGKTLLAAATSQGLDATFFNVKVSDLLSKYFGESTRLVSALFATARKLSPSVVFLDEFESLSPSRDGSQSGPESRIVSTFLSELDGLAQKGAGGYVLTIAATNVPWLIDKAMLSRFEKKIYVPLPDDAARRRILEIEINEHGHSSEVNLDRLVKRTEGLSGREISRLCKEAIKDMVNSRNPDLTKTVDAGREAMSDYQIKVGPITGKEWDAAFTRVRPETSAADLRRFADWIAGQD
jgi:katanin p60 ATPase-containing subunit A1